MTSPSASPLPIIPVARYSSAGQRTQDRYPEWREGSLLAFGRMYDTTSSETFGVETSLAQLGAVGFSHSRMSGQHWHRRREHVRRDEVNPLMVAIRFEGVGQGDANGREFAAPAEFVVLSDFAQPQPHVSDTAFTAVLHVPREIAERSLPAGATCTGWSFRRVRRRCCARTPVR